MLPLGKAFHGGAPHCAQTFITATFQHVCRLINLCGRLVMSAALENGMDR